MKAFWVAAAMAGGALLGVWWARRGKVTFSDPSNTPSPGSDTVRWVDPSSGYSETIVCPQVMATCKDGSVAPTPCDCASRGGVASLGGAL